MLMFRDRRHAGELLAELLSEYRERVQTVVLALPRGGVPVGAAVAQRLGLSMDVLGVRKIGAPEQPELAVGAVAGGGVVVMDERTVARMGISQATVDTAVARELEELLRRERVYRGERPPLELAGRTVILVDDGLATGYTMLAAARAARLQRPARVVVGVPVAPPETLERLRGEADEVCCVHVAKRLFAVGEFYDDFRQVSDEEVCAALARLRVPAE